MTVSGGPAEPSRLLDALTTLRAAQAEEADIRRRLDDLQATAAARRALPRDVRRILPILQRLPDTDQRAVSAAIRSSDPDVDLRALVVELEQRDTDGGSETSIVAGLLRGLLPTLRAVPAAVLAVRVLLLKLVGVGEPRPMVSLPPDRPVPKQARPGRLARCPHGPDLLAVGRPRHRAGVPALRAA